MTYSSNSWNILSAGPPVGFPSGHAFGRVGLKQRALTADTGGGMPRVQIHCYGCDATVPVTTAKSTEDLNRAGWSLARGETYCPKCAPARVPATVASPGAGDDLAQAGDEAANVGEDVGASSNGVSAAIAPREPIVDRPPGSGAAARMIAWIPWVGSGRRVEDHAERHPPRLRPAAAVVLSALQLPFRRSNGPVTSRSKVSSQTLLLFCIAAALTLATLGSEHMAIRLPGVLFSFAAGVSWLRDLRRSA